MYTGMYSREATYLGMVGGIYSRVYYPGIYHQGIQEGSSSGLSGLYERGRKSLFWPLRTLEERERASSGLPGP